MALTTAALFIALNKIIVKNTPTEKPICTQYLVLILDAEFVFFFLLKSKKSTQKDVVNAVRAESVVAKEAAVKPIMKTTAAILDK